MASGLVGAKLPNMGLSAIRAGATYFAIVFLIGFALGTVRTLVVAPRVGETAAVLIEAPALLAASWIACGWCVRRFGVPRRAAARLWMGGLAFALLMAAEAGVSVFAFGRTLAEHLAAYATAAGAIGLAAQALFGIIPVVRRSVEQRDSR